MTAPTLPTQATAPRSLMLTVQPGDVAPSEYVDAILTSLSMLIDPLAAELDDATDAVMDDDNEKKRVAATARNVRDARDYLRQQLEHGARVLAQHHRTL